MTHPTDHPLTNTTSFFAPNLKQDNTTALTIGLIALGTIVFIGSVFLALKGCSVGHLHITGLIYHVNDVTSWLILSTGVVFGGSCIGISLYLRRNTQQQAIVEEKSNETLAISSQTQAATVHKQRVMCTEPVRLAEPQNCNFYTVIERVKEASRQGFKTALLVGRSNGEPQPPQEKGWLWFTLDQDRDLLTDSTLHLHIPLTNETAKKIQGLFDRVVVDRAVMHLLGSPWKMLHALLKKTRSSELIAEFATTKSLSFDQTSSFDAETMQETRPFDEIAKANNNPTYKKEKTEEMQNICRPYLNRLFHSVTLVRNHSYPPDPLRYRENGISDYWILRDPIENPSW